MRPSRRWWAISSGALAVVGLVGFAHAATGPERTEGTVQETITYEITGPREVTGLWYGDVVNLAYSPYAATTVEHAALPWRVTVPATAARSSHDLSARSAEPTAMTCTVRRGAAVVSTQTAVGWVACDTTPASG